MTTRRGNYSALTALLLSLCIGATCGNMPAGARPQTKGTSVETVSGGHLGPQSTVGEILHHPAFVGFAPLMLPWDDRQYDETLPLTRIGTLLPYHTHVDPETVANALNGMIDDAANGATVFYRFYSEAQIEHEHSRKHTGLFFYRGKPGAPSAVICAGGGFSYVGSVHEGFPYAEAIRSKGYNAFVLKYRVGHGGTPATEDLAAALSYIFQNAASLGVGTDGYSLWGSSAGARMTAAIGSHGLARYAGGDVPKPATIVMAYTAHSDTSSAEPPTFVVVGERDGIAPPASMEARVNALRRSGTEVVYRRFMGLGHGFGPGTGTNAEGWILEAVQFWEQTIGRSR
jgi:acetyl esterase/lipase